MEAGVILLVLGLGLLSGSALLAFSWAARDGQLEELDRAAEVIFDAEEPVGVAGDRFPKDGDHFYHEGHEEHEGGKKDASRNLHDLHGESSEEDRG